MSAVLSCPCAVPQKVSTASNSSLILTEFSGLATKIIHKDVGRYPNPPFPSPLLTHKPAVVVTIYTHYSLQDWSKADYQPVSFQVLIFVIMHIY